MTRPKTYIIKLSDDERAVLQKVIRNKKTCKTVLKRYQILLELDEVQGTGLTHAQLAHSYAVCPATITNIVQSYVRNGIKGILRYNISPIPVLHGEKWMGVPKHISSRWLVDRPPRDILAGRYGSWKKKLVLNLILR